jgi:chemotaxis signal transduction protein
MRDESAMTEHKRKFIIFSLQSTLYALDLAQVAEVADPPKLSPIPLAQRCYSGALNFHGDIVAVLNLPLFLGLADSGNHGKIIMLRQEIASLALLVDSVVRIVSEDDVSFAAPPVNRFAAATLDLTDGNAIQLDLDSLVREAEFSMQKSP